MKIKVYDIEWEIDEGNLAGIRSHTGEKWGHLLSDAEDEQERLPTELELQVEEDSEAVFFDYEDLYWMIEKAAMGGCDNYYASLITDIFKREGCENEEIQINHEPFYEWQEKCATIDGLPIGVPVVDEELLSNP